MDKNKDLLFKDLSKAMYACERALLQELFPEGEGGEEWGRGRRHGGKEGEGEESEERGHLFLHCSSQLVGLPSWLTSSTSELPG